MYTYSVEITSVYDGDTVTCNIDLGFGIKKENVKLRLANINTPEIRNKDLEAKARGYAARDFLRGIVEDYSGCIVVTTTEKGKYGRWIADLYIDAGMAGYDDFVEKHEGARESGTDLININQILVDLGHAERKYY